MSFVVICDWALFLCSTWGAHWRKIVFRILQVMSSGNRDVICDSVSASISQSVSHSVILSVSHSISEAMRFPRSLACVAYSCARGTLLAAEPPREARGEAAREKFKLTCTHTSRGSTAKTALPRWSRQLRRLPEVIYLMLPFPINLSSSSPLSFYNFFLLLHSPRFCSFTVTQYIICGDFWGLVFRLKIGG